MYKKLTIVFKNNPNSVDEFDGGTYTVTYENTSIVVSGDYLVLTTQEQDEKGDGYVQGKIHHLKEVLSYRGQ